MNKKAFDNLLHKFAAPQGVGPQNIKRDADKQKRFQQLQQQLNKQRRTQAVKKWTGLGLAQGAAEGVKTGIQAVPVVLAQWGINDSEGQYKMVYDRRTGGYRPVKRTAQQRQQYLNQKLQYLADRQGTTTGTLKAGTGLIAGGAATGALAGVAAAAPVAAPHLVRWGAQRAMPWVAKKAVPWAAKQVGWQALDQAVTNTPQAIARYKYRDADPQTRRQAIQTARKWGGRLRIVTSIPQYGNPRNWFRMGWKKTLGNYAPSGALDLLNIGAGQVANVTGANKPTYTLQELQQNPELLSQVDPAQVTSQTQLQSKPWKAYRPYIPFVTSVDPKGDPRVQKQVFASQRAQNDQDRQLYLTNQQAAQKPARQMARNQLGYGKGPMTQIVQTANSLRGDTRQRYLQQQAERLNMTVPQLQAAAMQGYKEQAFQNNLTRARRKAQKVQQPGYIQQAGLWLASEDDSNQAGKMLRNKVTQQTAKYADQQMQFYRDLHNANPQQRKEMIQMWFAKHPPRTDFQNEALRKGWRTGDTSKGQYNTVAQVVNRMKDQSTNPSDLLPVVQGKKLVDQYLKSQGVELPQDQYTQQVMQQMTKRYIAGITQKVKSTDNPMQYAQQLMQLRDAYGFKGKESDQIRKILQPRIKQQIWKDPINNMPKAIGLWLTQRGASPQVVKFFGSKGGLYGTIGGIGTLTIGAPLLFGLLRRRPAQPDYKSKEFQDMLDRAMQMNAQRNQQYRRTYA